MEMALKKICSMQAAVEEIKKNVHQENGQLIYINPLLANVSRPKGTEVFVNRLPTDLSIYDLLPLFMEHGSVHSARLMMNLNTKNRGFAYVRFMTVESMNSAIKHLDGYQIMRGMKLRVSKSTDNCRLFIGRIDKYLTREDIFKVLQVKTEGVADVILYLSAADKDQNRGFCFVEYTDHKYAAMARRKLVSEENLFVNDCKFKIDWALPEPDIDPNIMAKVKVIFVGNLLLATSSSSLRHAVTEAIDPKSIVRLCKLTDYAFIHFRERKIAEMALNHLNGYTLDGAVLKADWAKPISKDIPENHDEQRRMKGGSRDTSFSSSSSSYFGSAGSVSSGSLYPHSVILVDRNSPHLLNAKEEYDLMMSNYYIAKTYGKKERQSPEAILIPSYGSVTTSITENTQRASYNEHIFVDLAVNTPLKQYLSRLLQVLPPSEALSKGLEIADCQTEYTVKEHGGWPVNFYTANLTIIRNGIPIHYKPRYDVPPSVTSKEAVNEIASLFITSALNLNYRLPQPLF